MKPWGRYCCFGKDTDLHRHGIVKTATQVWGFCHVHRTRFAMTVPPTVRLLTYLSEAQAEEQGVWDYRNVSSWARQPASEAAEE